MSYTMYMLNIVIDVFGVAISFVGFVSSIIASRINHMVKRYFITLFIFMMIYVLSNLLGLIFRGSAGGVYRIILYMANFCEFLFSGLLAYMVSNYLVDISVKEEKRKQRIKAIFVFLLTFYIFMLLVSQFTGLYYVIGEDNIYHRSSLFPLSFISPAIMLLIDLGILIESRKTLSLNQKTAFWAYLVLPVIGIILQIFIYGIDFIVIATVLAGIVMFILVVIDQTERNIRAEMENENIKASLLLGQISPHFIFNSLMSIQDLCYSDPETAAKGIGDFAVYLRHNMDDLTINTMIPFEKELGFIKEYIRLEKLDPDRDFEVHFQLNEIDFYMPTLTLQPVVENAINYGALTCKNQKGRVEISTDREGNNIVIRVWNNFEGRRSVTEGQRKHRSIALENLKSRLKYYCDGTFDIVIGEKDALATITIPYDKAKGGLFDENDHH